MSPKQEVFVPATEFSDALKSLIVNVKKKEASEVIFFCHGDELVIRLGASECRFERTGSFTGQARIRGKVILGILDTLPKQEFLRLSKKEDSLDFGDYSLTCIWEDVEYKRIRLALNADDIDYLGIAVKFTDDEIEKAGLRPNISGA